MSGVLPDESVVVLPPVGCLDTPAEYELKRLIDMERELHLVVTRSLPRLLHEVLLP